MWSSRLASIFAVITVALSTSSFAEIKSSGSGFAIGDGSSIVTDYHVVKSCSTINIPDIGSASVVKSDPKADLAILKPSKPLPIGLRFRSGHPVKLGEEIVVIGFPLRGLLSSGPTVTTGIVSSLAGIGGDRTQMQISAPVQQGNSGGPVLDKSGNVVGVVVSKLDAIRAAILTGDIPQNVNFAIQSSIATSVLDSYSIDYQVGSSENDKPTSEIVSFALPAIVVLECLREQKPETVAIPPARQEELPPPPPDLPGKLPTIGISQSWSEQRDGRQKTIDNLSLTLTARQQGKDRLTRLDAVIEGGPAVTVYGVPSFFTSLGATTVVLQLDPENNTKDVIFGTYTGGAHCCTSIKILSLIQGSWKVIDLGEWDGDPEGVVPQAPQRAGADKTPVLVFGDDSFLYAFTFYAESATPLKLFRLRDGNLIDVSSQEEFRDLHRKNMLENQKLCEQQKNGGCAAFVASAARIGLYKWAWDFMLRHFDRHSDWKLSFCDGPVDKSCPRQIAFTDYPTALRWFLAKHGYLTDQQEPKAEVTQEVSTEFTDGLSDRRAWEQWFGGLTGEFREGASFWSGQRSLPKPGSCSDQRYSQQFISGCAAAKAQLMRSDARRKSEPDYRRGWNSYPE